MSIKVGGKPSDGKKSPFFSPKANTTVKLTLLSDSDEIVQVDQCEIWDTQPAVIWPQNEDYDPSRELKLRPALRSFMWVLVDDDPEPKIWSLRSKQHQELLDIKEANDGESLKGMVIQVKRTGSGFESRYTTTSTPRRAKSLPSEIPGPEVIIERLNVRTGEAVKQEIMNAFSLPWSEIVEMYHEKYEAEKAKRKREKGGPAEGEVEAL